MLIVTPAAGTHTFTLAVQAYGDMIHDLSYTPCVIQAIELKQ